MVGIQSAAAEIRRGIKKEEEDRKKPQGKNIMSASATQGGHNYLPLKENERRKPAKPISFTMMKRRISH